MGLLLQVRDLRTYFYTRNGIVKAVDGITYDVAEGEIVGIVGESGSGKSAGALSLLRLVDPPKGRITDGEILFEGRDILKLNEDEIRSLRGKKMAMVFQEPMTSLNPVLTVGKQISESLQLHLNMSKRAATARSAKLLEMVGIPEARKRLSDYPHQLSGGMRQRVMIAMALSCSPRLLIADEPTSALDVTTQAQILEVIRKSTSEIGTAVILITHNLGLAAGYVERIIVMYAGRIVETAPVKEIFSNPKHPYTIALLRSVPRLDKPVEERLVSIEGSAPHLIDAPPGCAFLPRCSYASDKCAELTPELMPVNENHKSACRANI